jgi:biotin carboxyl carrier protein
MKMREKIIKKLIRLVEESDIDVLEVSSWGRKVRITRRMENLPSGNGENPVRQYVTPPKAAHESAQPSPPPETPPQKPQLDE